MFRKILKVYWAYELSGTGQQISSSHEQKTLEILLLKMATVAKN